ncbi:hypothetical protein GCM10009604_21570 [Corynebacterium aurimucosum]|uniref:WecB/TagA/CpsF family glycosyltransferase n=1 Tax=Corynebacterium aurimucosum TaxID=169292 RepID=UPI00191DDCFC|nr:WecB/TagA/CpsF family glycosyltransferase [Corynebacterium aurimucosum]QQU95709.1 WecB/TagA/CpsF family glycosyltransferase [Corynebacterium aurimucosum]UTA71407.1 WecB/TagA/CpsF family glycosyltransferase [Corynebacterium aurimucosum]WJY69582.1 UDP-Gal:alpha-D-GlcNAc-diphosphoundecaprenol beta-1,4-galactosyltransferase [Corynebacterium aurimucosum]
MTYNSTTDRVPSSAGASPAPDPAVAEFARRIARPGAVVTWLNHWSVQQAQWSALETMTDIGIDGTLLQLMLARCGMDMGRTSADLVLPVLFRDVLEPDQRIAFIGSAPGVATRAAERIGGHQTCAFDGYGELKELRRDPSQLRAWRPDVVVLGLGAPLQEEVAAELHVALPEAIVCTAGGWIDQLAANEQYFPVWVHKYRLGWAWRIAHEPRRLIGRYTVDAVGFLRRLPRIVSDLRVLPHKADATGFHRG